MKRSTAFLASLTVALSASLSAAGQQHLSIATGGTGGVYYPLGSGLAQLISNHLTGYRAIAEVTGASVENVGLVSREQSDVAFALSDTVSHAYHGQGRFENRQLTNLRALASLYVNALHLVTLAGSDIESLEDLRGKRVSIGAPGSGTEVSVRTLLAANGLALDEMTTQRLNFNETANALRDGLIDAGFWSVGPPTSSIVDLATTRDIRIISLDDETIERTREAEPVFVRYEMEEGVYPGQDAPVATIGTANVLVVNQAMDNELAFRLTALVYAGKDYLAGIHPAANAIDPELTLETAPIPLHPGARHYFRQMGHGTPEELHTPASEP